MTARPPDFSTAAWIASESVATTASPIPAACARRKTCTIIGSPAISNSGLPGRRVAAMRAGMRMMALGVGMTIIKTNVQWVLALIRVARAGAKRLSVRRRRSRALSGVS